MNKWQVARRKKIAVSGKNKLKNKITLSSYFMKRNLIVLSIISLLYFSNALAGTVEIISSQDSLEAPLLAAPLNMSRLQPTNNLTVQWNSSPGANNYQFQYSLDSSFTYSGIVDDYSVSDTLVILSSLKNETTYFWRVRAKSGFISGNWSQAWSFTTTPLPAAVNLFFPENNLVNQENNIQFVWNKAPQNTTYLLQLSPDSTFSDYNSIIKKSVNDTAVQLYNLNYNTIFYWHVKAFNIDGAESNWSVIRNFETKLSPPQILHPYGIGLDTALIFEWLPVDSAKKYRLQISSNKNFDDASLLFNSIVDSSGLSVPNFKLAHTYFWRISALNSKGDSSDWSKIIQLQIRLATPEVIFPKDSSNNVDTVVNFSWSKVDSAVNYRLVVSTDTSFTKLLTDTVISSTQISLTKFEHYTRYYWRLLALNRVLNFSNWTAARTFKTNIQVPYLYSPVNNLINNTDTVKFNWDRIKGAESYRFQAAYDSAFARIFINTKTNDSLYLLSKLLPDTTFCTRLMAFNSEGDSTGWSNVIKFATNPLFKVTGKNILDTLNISENPADSIAAITLFNNGPNTLFIDSIKIDPDSILSIDTTGIVLGGNSQIQKIIRLNRNKILPGENFGSISFIRINSRGEKQNYNLNISFFIEKALPYFSPDTLDFGLVTSDSAGYKGLSLRNFGGNIDVKITKIFQVGPDSSSFNLYNNPNLVKANQSTFLPVEFKPLKIGVNSSTIEIETNSSPIKNFQFILKGIGKGGELSTATINSIKGLSDSTFESLISPGKFIGFKNTGDTTLKLGISFSKNIWGFDSNNSYSPVIKSGDSVSIFLRYLARNFNPLNTDTMIIHHNGFGENPIIVLLKGSFDKSRLIPLILNNITINNSIFPGSGNEYWADSTISIDIDSSFISTLLYPDFRFKYYMGNVDTALYAAQMERFEFIIPSWKVGDGGLVFSGELLMRNNNDKIVDSVLLFNGFSPRIIIKGYNPPVIKVPRSIPGKSADEANVKWSFFGFPFDTVFVDSVFNYFGGRNNMRDGEWMLYKYDAANKNSFSGMNSEIFQPNSAYFFAQALVDTFEISNVYYRNILTRRLTDTVMTFSGSDWKTVSDPFTFNVQVEPPAMLFRYNTGKQAFEMTNIMKPGEGYFLEPAINSFSLKTYGKYTPANIPESINEAGWYVNLKINDNSKENSLLFSLNNQSGLGKVNSNLIKEDYAVPPRIQKGLYSYIEDQSGGMYGVSVKAQTAGAAWDVVISNDLSDDNVAIHPQITGRIPEGIKFALYDYSKKKLISDSSFSFYLSKNELKKFKILIGTEKFIEQNFGSLNNQHPYSFELFQNYPNPFNPSTTIKYTVPGLGVKPVDVQLKVYDVLGNEVATLVNGEQYPGEYQVKFNAQTLASGVYFYRILAGGYVSIKKMLLLK